MYKSTVAILFFIQAVLALDASAGNSAEKGQTGRKLSVRALDLRPSSITAERDVDTTAQMLNSPRIADDLPNAGRKAGKNDWNCDGFGGTNDAARENCMRRGVPQGTPGQPNFVQPPVIPGSPLPAGAQGPSNFSNVFYSR